MENEILAKSIDGLIADIFEEPIEKSIDIAGDSKTKADEVVNKAPKGQDDASRGAGRPKEISDVPDTDEDGKRAGSYDSSIAGKQSEDDLDEADQVKEGDPKEQKTAASKVVPLRKSVELDDAEYAEFQAFKKSQVEAQEQLQKAEQVKEQEQLIKSAVLEATESLQKANDDLHARFEAQEQLIKSIAKAPQRAKSVVGLEHLEKGSDPVSDGPQAFSKSEVLDAAEELVKGGTIPMEAVIEIENTGVVYNPEHKQAIEQHLAQR